MKKTKNILCFGDSNTWGYNPKDGSRFAYQARWTGNLAGRLGEDYFIIEEGLNGRTTVFDDPYTFTHSRNGSKNLPMILNPHKPLDLVILFLGTNDLKRTFNAEAHMIAKGMESLIKIVRSILAEELPEIVVVSPPNIAELSDFKEEYEEASRVLHKLPSAYEKVAVEQGVHFLNITDRITASPLDGVHLDEKGHQNLAEMMEKKIKEMI
ncbi:MAG TPA: hydrolase [Eubacteriaceae bacterium]|nr:hydrolase [Eubacteriaceae bacterium]